MARSAVFWRQVGEVVNLLGWRLAALRAFELAVRRHPQSAVPHYRLGEALARGAQWRRAARAFADASRLAPKDAEYRGNLVLALWKSGQYGAALLALDRLVFLEPRAGEPHLLQGALLAKLGEKALALRALREAAEIAPSPKCRRFLLGEAVLGATEWNAAVSAWRAAAGPVEPPRDSLRRRAGRRIGQLTEAWIPRTDIQTLKGALLLRLGHRQRALRALARAATPASHGASRSPVLDGLLRAAGLQASRTAVSVLARSAAARQKPRCAVLRRSAPARPQKPPRGATLMPFATLLAALGLGALLVLGARSRTMASVAADSGRARILAETCLAERGLTAIDACRKALLLPLSPERTALVRRTLARELQARSPADMTTAFTSVTPANSLGSGRP